MVKQRLTALVACLALIGGGLAWAATTESKEADLNGAFGVDAILVPGAEGGADVVFVDGWNEEVEMSIGFDPAGNVTVNGEVVGATDAGHTHHVHVDLMETSTGFVANVTVTDTDLNLVVAMQGGVGLGVDAPAKVRATGQFVLSVSAE